jgi:hypothetical protein
MFQSPRPPARGNSAEGLSGPGSSPRGFNWSVAGEFLRIIRRHRKTAANSDRTTGKVPISITTITASNRTQNYCSDVRVRVRCFGCRVLNVCHGNRPRMATNTTRPISSCELPHSWPNFLVNASAKSASAKHERITEPSAVCVPWPRCGLMPC